MAILAGGRATRLRPLTETKPKAMVEVNGRPFIQHQIALLRANGLRDIVMCTGHLGEQIECFVGDGARFDVRVWYSSDGDTLLGTAGALRKAKKWLDSPFFVLYGDSYLDVDYQEIYRRFVQSGEQALMTVYRNRGRWDVSNVVFAEGQVRKYDKQNPSPDMEYIDYGLSVLTPEILEAIPDNRASDLAAVYHSLVGEGRLAGLEVFNRFYEIGTHKGLRELEEHLSGRDDSHVLDGVLKGD